jgi:hypothetical protein
VSEGDLPGVKPFPARDLSFAEDLIDKFDAVVKYT